MRLKFHTALRNFSRLYVRDYLDVFEKAMYKRFTQTKVFEVSKLQFINITTLQTHGLMFLKKKTKKSGDTIVIILYLINKFIVKFILTYRKLNNNFVSMEFSDGQEIESLSQNLEKIFRITMVLIVASQTTNANIETKNDKIDHLKYNFKIAYIEKYYKYEQKK